MSFHVCKISFKSVSGYAFYCQMLRGPLFCGQCNLVCWSIFGKVVTAGQRATSIFDLDFR